MKKFFFYILILVSLSLFSEEKSVSLVTDHWIPIYSSNLENDGFFTEIVRKSFKKVNYEFSVSFLTWSEAMRLAKTKKYDGLLGAYYKEEREKDFLYSLPVYSVKSIFLTRKDVDIKYDKNLKNLKGFKVGVSKGYTYGKDFDNANYLNKVVGESPDEILKMLINKEIDVLIIQSDVAEYLIINKFPDEVSNLKFLGPSLIKRSLYIAISRKNNNCNQIINDFNIGLKMLVRSGEMDEILKKK